MLPCLSGLFAYRKPTATDVSTAPPADVPTAEDWSVKTLAEPRLDGHRPKAIKPFSGATDVELEIIDRLNNAEFGRSIPAAVMRDLVKYHVFLASQKIGEELANGILPDGTAAQQGAAGAEPAEYGVQQLGMALLHHEAESYITELFRSAAAKYPGMDVPVDADMLLAQHKIVEREKKHLISDEVLTRFDGDEDCSDDESVSEGSGVDGGETVSSDESVGEADDGCEESPENVGENGGEPEPPGADGGEDVVVVEEKVRKRKARPARIILGGDGGSDSSQKPNRKRPAHASKKEPDVNRLPTTCVVPECEGGGATTTASSPPRECGGGVT